MFAFVKVDMISNSHDELNANGSKKFGITKKYCTIIFAYQVATKRLMNRSGNAKPLSLIR